MNKRKTELYQDLIARLYPQKHNNEIKDNKIQTANITFQITDDCNLSCTYCYQINKNKHIMPIEIAQKFIDLLLDNSITTQQYIDTRQSDAVVLDFIGGEPFLQPDLIDEIIQYFIKRTIETNHPWQYNWMISISSNGTLYFKPEVQKFIKKYQDFLSLSISIDGNKQLHDSCRIFPDGTGSYDLAIAAVHDFFQTYKLGHMGSKMTLAPQNIQYTAEAVISLLNEGYTEINLNCVFEQGWTENHAFILYQQLKILGDYILNNNLENDVFISIFDETLFCPKSITDDNNWCGGNGRMIAIDWKGDIYPCLRFMESSLGNNIKPIIIGNVYDGFGYNQNCLNCIKELKSIGRLNQSTDECINCQIAEGCAWCQAYNYQDSKGNLKHRATYICLMHQARALSNCYFWNKKYRKNNELKRMKLWLTDEQALKIINKEELQLLKNLQYPIK